MELLVESLCCATPAVFTVLKTVAQDASLHYETAPWAEEGGPMPLPSDYSMHSVCSRVPDVSELHAGCIAIWMQVRGVYLGDSYSVLEVTLHNFWGTGRQLCVRVASEVEVLSAETYPPGTMLGFEALLGEAFPQL